jgi:hypothetical protein
MLFSRGDAEARRMLSPVSGSPFMDRYRYRGPATGDCFSHAETRRGGECFSHAETRRRGECFPTFLVPRSWIGIDIGFGPLMQDKAIRLPATDDCFSHAETRRRGECFPPFPVPRLWIGIVTGDWRPATAFLTRRRGGAEKAEGLLFTETPINNCFSPRLRASACQSQIILSYPH